MKLKNMLKALKFILTLRHFQLFFSNIFIQYDAILGTDNQVY